jgi:hypothetical protein
MQINQQKCLKPKIRERKIRNGVNWKEALKQKGVKQEMTYLYRGGARTYSRRGHRLSWVRVFLWLFSFPPNECRNDFLIRPRRFVAKAFLNHVIRHRSDRRRCILQGIDSVVEQYKKNTRKGVSLSHWYTYPSDTSQEVFTCVQATSRRSFIVEARFISQANPYAIYSGKVVVGNVFLRVFHVSHVSIISPVLHIHIFSPTSDTL